MVESTNQENAKPDKEPSSDGSPEKAEAKQEADGDALPLEGALTKR